MLVRRRGMVDFRNTEPDVPKDHPFATKEQVWRFSSHHTSRAGLQLHPFKPSCSCATQHHHAFVHACSFM
jgi:hypothetical protein